MRKLLLIALLASAACTGSASAQTMEDRLRDQLRSTMTQLQQLQDDQASLQAAKAAAEKERDSLKTELAAAKAQLAKAQKQTDKSPELEAEIAKYKDSYTQAASSAQKTQAERDGLQTTLAGMQTMLTACEAKNDKLLAVGKEILDAYSKFSFNDAFFANEPFIGERRVELENLAQDYGDKLYDGKFDPRAVHVAAPINGSVSAAPANATPASTSK